MWSFVGHKGNKAWVWLALCRRTRQVVAVAVGDRSAATCRRLWDRIPAAYRYKRTYTDFWDAYGKVVPERHHRPCGKEEGQTNHIERFNNTIRQRLGRFVRKTLSFSKSLKMHWYCLLLFLHQHNQKCARKWQAQQL
jgi:insertion element IS1 protein InsB